MAESIAEQIKAALRTRLASIVADGGASYWYTPSAVVRCRQYSESLCDASLGTPAVIYAIRSERKTHREEATGSEALGGRLRCDMEMFVLMLMHGTSSSTSPHEEPLSEPIEDTICERMERDVLRALLVDADGLNDATLAGLTLNSLGDEGVESSDYDVPGWIARELRFVLPFVYYSRTP